ncbi:MAG: hypothetical protein J0M30_10245 [Chitinophagales bacterium]|nr:hypothetical protein [Chitinophagales bacterium]
MKNKLSLFMTISTLLILVIPISCTKTGESLAANPTGAGGSTARFTIAGNFLYVVDHTSLKSFEITDPNRPVYKDITEVGLNIETIFPYQDKLFIGSSSSMYIYSLQDPARPQRLSKSDYTLSMACDPIYVKDSVAYAALRVQLTGPCSGRGGLGNSALQVYDIKNPALPVLKNVMNLYSPQGLGVKDSALYVCEREQGLHIFNVTQPYNPIDLGLITGETFYDVIPYGNILIAQVAGGFRLYDIGTNPLQPQLVSSLQN